jgi:hypothetical protein
MTVNQRLPLTPASYWSAKHVGDEIVTVNGGRLNLTLLHKVLLARAVADLREAKTGRVREAGE